MSTLVQEANRIEESEVGVMVILDRSGDTRHTWDRNNAGEVEAMGEIFDTMIDKGYQAWSVTRKGNKDQRITEFDPQAEKVIFAPALVGG
jgi:metallophosphoesterase superfamily enzyme